jgi:hypothetical protein
MKKVDLENDKKINSGFNVPERYFDEFNSKMISKLNYNESKKNPVFSIKKIIYYGAAAILVIGFFLNRMDFSEKNTEIDDFAYETNMSNEDIAEQLTDFDIKTIEKNLNLNYNLKKRIQ